MYHRLVRSEIVGTPPHPIGCITPSPALRCGPYPRLTSSSMYILGKPSTQGSLASCRGGIQCHAAIDESTTDLTFATGLPIAEVLPQILESIATTPNLVVEAPPGAGKTTTIPLSVLQLIGSTIPEGKILVLEPRRLAARNAATQMSKLLGQKVGQTVGFRTRYEKAVSAETRVEVVTEGILLRRLQREPELSGVAAILFDEFHERNLDSDVSLALAVDVQTALRPELRIICMSATLGNTLAGKLSALLGGGGGREAPIIRSMGRSYPIRTVYVGPPAVSRDGLETAVANAIARALGETPSGDVLAFLPGLREIRRTQVFLESSRAVSPASIAIRILHGSLSPQDQDLALRPDAEGRRKVILSSPIAESSLTIPGVRIVVDSGLERRSRYDTDLGFDRLEVAKISRQSADQRQGRAGREAPGSCYRLWSEATQTALPEATPPEILRVDLTPLALELCSWGGSADGSDLQWVDGPKQDLLAGARQLLRDLDMLDARDRPTETGKRARMLACHPRLARMILQGAEWGHGDLACVLAAMCEEKDVLRGRQTSADVGLRLEAMMGGRGYDTLDRGATSRVRSAANQLRAQLARALRTPSEEAEESVDPEELEPVDSSTDSDTDAEDAADATSPSAVAPVALEAVGALPMEEAAGLLLAVAFPDRIAQRRSGGGRDGGTNYVMASGTGVNLRGGAADPLSTCEYLAVASLSGESSDARNKAIYLAAPIRLAQVAALLPSLITEERVVFWAPSSKSVQSRQRRRIGSLVLQETPVEPTPEEVTAGLLDGIMKHMGGISSLGLSVGTQLLLQRAAWVRRRDLVFQGDSDLPDTSDTALGASIAKWLGPVLSLSGAKSKADLAKVDVNGAARGILTWEQAQRIERLAPERWEAPTGSKIVIDYTAADDNPTCSVRLQELFGQQTTPSVYDGRVPLTLALLSPSQRPVQTTKDLVSFWANAYFEVKKELKARYPKHSWPENPLEADPVRGVKKKTAGDGSGAGKSAAPQGSANVNVTGPAGKGGKKKK